MSLVALEIPKVGLVMENARLVRWLKQVGDLVKQGEPLLELETEKSVVEIESTESGRLVEILMQPDQEARVGDRVAWLENDPGAAGMSGSRGQGPGASGAEAAPQAPGFAASGGATLGSLGQGAAVNDASASRGAAAQGTMGGAQNGAPGSRGAAPDSTTARSAVAGGGGRAANDAAVTQQVASGRIKSSPVARRLAAEYSIDLRQVAATGPRGRIQLSDVRREIELRRERKGPAANDASPATFEPGAGGASGTGRPSGAGSASGSGHAPGAGSASGSGHGSTFDRALGASAGAGAGAGGGRASSGAPLAAAAQPLSSMRRAVARTMALSNATVPQFIVERAVDWTTVQGVRVKLTAGLPATAVKPTVNDFLLQAIARTLLAFPELNATFTGDANSPDAALLPASGTHIGLVVAVENGLLVPVLHDVDRLGILELARRRSETVQRATSGRLKREELEGATFSLSNLGARGPDRFTAIISPPQSAILAVGRQRDCVVAINGGIHVRPMSQLTLTVDHRVADGRLAADFLASLVEVLEGDAWRLN